jgi:hypothetical protein
MKRNLTICLAGAICLFFIAGAANAARVRVGTLILRADGGFEPRVLPRHAYAPIRFQGHAEIGTTNSEPPPALRRVRLDFDRDGRLTTAGLPVCPPSRIEGTAPMQARQLCKGAIVGTGHVGVAISVPGHSRVDVTSPLTLFNGPRQGGDPTVIAHAQTTFPAPETYVVTIPIERSTGTYGYRTTFDLPEIANGHGALTHIDAKIGRRYSFRGSKRSYTSARCSDGVLQTHGFFYFADGTIISGAVFRPCTPLG